VTDCRIQRDRTTTIACTFWVVTLWTVVTRVLCVEERRMNADWQADEQHSSFSVPYTARCAGRTLTSFPIKLRSRRTVDAKRCRDHYAADEFQSPIGPDAPASGDTGPASVLLRQLLSPYRVRDDSIEIACRRRGVVPAPCEADRRPLYSLCTLYILYVCRWLVPWISDWSIGRPVHHDVHIACLSVSARWVIITRGWMTLSSSVGQMCTLHVLS